MEEEVKTEVIDKGKKIDEVLSMNAVLIVGAVEKVAGRDLTDEEKKLIVDSAKAYHMLCMLTMKSVL